MLSAQSTLAGCFSSTVMWLVTSVVQMSTFFNWVSPPYLPKKCACISTILHATKSQRPYKITWDDLSASVLLWSAFPHPSASSTAAMTAVSVAQPWLSWFNIPKWFILLPPPIMPKAGFSVCILPCVTTSRDGVILPRTALASKPTYAIHMQQVNVVSVLYNFLVSKDVSCSYRCCPAITSHVLPWYFSIWYLLWPPKRHCRHRGGEVRNLGSAAPGGISSRKPRTLASPGKTTTRIFWWNHLKKTFYIINNIILYYRIFKNII